MDWDKHKETLVSLFVGRVRESGASTALYIHRGARPAILATVDTNRAGPPDSHAKGPPAPPGFEAISWDALANDVRLVALALGRLDVSAGDRVAQVSGNRYPWIVVDLAIHLRGGVHVALHSALSPEQMAWQILDSESRLVIGRSDSPFFSRAADLLAGTKTRLASDDELAQLAAAEAMSASDAQSVREQALARTTPDRLATILYTSGTTGEPKGVMLSHGNLAFNALASLETFEPLPEDLRIGWLPLSHIFARTGDLYIWLASGIPLGLAQSRETLLADIAALRPTVMNGVPYFFDKLARYLISQGRADEPGALVQLLGGRMRFACSGGAPLANHTAEFFQRQGLLLVQGYGLTEAAPVITTGNRKNHRLGTVGPPIPGVEVRIASDGEVLTRGPHVMLGYWKRPQDTAAMISDGWLATGDLGEIIDGHLRIVGRKKELIVLSSGKKVAPASIESRLEADPLIAQAMLVGDGRRFLAALVAPDLAQLQAALSAARDVPSADAAYEEAPLDDPLAPALFAERIARRLADVAQWEQVCKFVLVSRPFSVENGLLTATLKLRRDVIEKRYAAEIEAMYACEEESSQTLPCQRDPVAGPRDGAPGGSLERPRGV